MDLSEHELMVRLAGGEDLALNELMGRWGPRVASFLHRMTGQRDVANDLAQETFVKLYQARGRYKPSGGFSTYLFAIAANLARNHARWKARHPAISIDAHPDEDGSAVPDMIDTRQTPEESAQSAEKIRAVQAAFQRLSPDLREAMSLFVYEGMGYAEIATVMQCSPKAVETRIYRARQLLKELLSDFIS